MEEIQVPISDKKVFGVNKRNKNALRFFMHLVGSDLNN